MEVKPCHKQTEMGAIPEDWEVKPLGRFVALQRGHDLTERERRRGDVPVMGSAGPNGFHDTALVRGPGVVLGRSGASFGQAHYCASDFWPHNTALYVTDFFGNHPLFSFYLLKSINFSRHNSGGAQQSLNRNFIAPILVAVPERNEQEAIAEALSDADALIESLEQFISKKRHLKQGAMQELLRKKVGWVAKALGEICTISKERFDPLSSAPERKCVELEHLSSETGRLLDHLATTDLRSQKTVFRKGDILFGKLRPYLRKFWHATFDGVCSTELWVIKASSGIDVGWLYWLVQTDSILNAANRSSGTKMPRAEWATVSRTEVHVPPEESEQTAIAIILSDMDAEITWLEAELAKARQLKQGMMQELLTGKVRLV